MVGVPVSYSLSDHVTVYVGRPDILNVDYTETYLFWLVPFENNLKAMTLSSRDDQTILQLNNSARRL